MRYLRSRAPRSLNFTLQCRPYEPSSVVHGVENVFNRLKPIEFDAGSSTAGSAGVNAGFAAEVVLAVIIPSSEASANSKWPATASHETLVSRDSCEPVAGHLELALASDDGVPVEFRMNAQFLLLFK